MGDAARGPPSLSGPLLLPRVCAGSVRREPVVERKECLNCSIRVLTSPLPRPSARGDVLYDMCYDFIWYTSYVSYYL